MNKLVTKNKELEPKRSTLGSAGYDFFAPYDFVVPAHGLSPIIDSEVAVKLDKGYVFLCYVRSSFGFKYNTTLANGTGIIDSDFYPNTIKCILKNDSDMDLIVHKGDKYMQGVLMLYSTFENEEEPTTKRTGGIGSTGK